MGIVKRTYVKADLGSEVIDMLDYLNQIRKALVPVIVVGIIGALGYLGVSEQMTVKEAVELLVAGVFVWAIPNAKG